ncbi:bacteriophage N4 adsorption protein A [Burkholderia sp. Bp9017]|uniref:Tetratricopeptide repeat protein n=1 Tax=Burkholderia anthina TaxID=179879 RepID=A0A7T7AKZ9_9BURK|nr:MULTISPECIES: tetratricopeptide repeat protein [Burkholderia]MBY4869067.1 tetratricopeptide repeat protein [Burkholderia anthina]QQK06378.1 tetratricopeptide repeat protein [Burkholderia anthina]RQZ27556.1 bacteriophage N4 adsorption protein A [Burkholderia sp. Bp9016]RQZ30113.1 bacteriophage N4 adsorption protein A [Burkholderia sp. Bp9017]
MKRATRPIAASLKRCARSSALAIAMSLAWQAPASAARPLTPKAYRLADGAYKAINAGDLPRAEDYASRALRIQPGSEQLGLLLVDVYRREGKVDEADALVESLNTRFPKSASVLAQHGYMAQRQMRYDVACGDFSAAVATGKWSDEQQRNLRLAWADSALAAKRPHEAGVALAPLADEKSAAIQVRIAQMSLQAGDNESAVRVAELAAGDATTDGERNMAASIVAQARQADQPAPVPVDDTATRKLQQAYDLLREHKDREALDAFQEGFAGGAGNAMNYADAGYAAKRIGLNEQSVQFFEHSLDADENEHAFDAQRKFGYRREVEQLERTWGFVLSAPYQSAAFGPQGTISVLQPGIEAYWQPPKIGYQNGRILQFFVRGYGTAYDGTGNVTGMPTVQGSVGARYKPLADQNVVLTAERLFHIGSLSTTDWLMRLGYSSEGGTDLRVTEPSWRSWQAYVEGAYFIKAGRYIIYSELRYGHTWRLPMISDRLTVYPHVAVAGDHDNRQPDETAIGAGPGIQLRYWFREGRYSAPASYLDVTVQYRFPLTSAVRARGLVVRATLWF